MDEGQKASEQVSNVMKEGHCLVRRITKAISFLKWKFIQKKNPTKCKVKTKIAGCDSNFRT